MKKLMMAAMVAVVTMVAAADDYSFTYQAELKNDKGQALSSRNQTVEIRLWKNATGNSEGDLLWGRTYNIYTDENGLFNQEISDSLGSLVNDWPSGKIVLSLSAIFTNNGAGMVYLGLKVKDSAGEITPRQRLFAVPFAGRANSANNLVGDAHNIEGTLNLAGMDAALSASGLVLPSSSTSTVGSVTAENLHVKNDVTFAGSLQYNGTLSGSDGKSIIPVPIGGVIMWTKKEAPGGGTWDESGKSADGFWAICNGKNDTPNLCGRFVVGVGEVQDKADNKASYELKDEGGYIKHKLTTDEMPAHRHRYLSDNRIAQKLSSHDYAYEPSGDIYGFNFNTKDSGTWGSHYGSESVGKDVAHENRPPYFALYYIMRVQ